MEEEDACTGWNNINPLCYASEGVNAVVGQAIENMAAAVMEAFGKVVGSLGTMWVNIGTPELTGTGAQTTAIQAGTAAPDNARLLTLVLGYVTWIGLAIAVLSLIVLGALIAAKMRRGEGVAAVGKLGLLLVSVIVISSAGALVAGLTPSGPSNAGGTVLFLQSGLWWYMGAAAVLSVIVGGLRMAWEQRAEPGRDTVKGLLTLIVVAGAGVTIIGILVEAADAFAVWLINSSLSCNVETDPCFGEGLLTLLSIGGPLSAGLGPLLIIILGLIAILASVVQIVLMVARGGMLVILAGILPLSASFTSTEMGKQWFRKAIAWVVAFILYKPAAAIVYAAAFQLVGTTSFSDDGTGLLSALTGLMLMVIALFALPALMRFVTPMVGAMAGGGGGGGAAVGAMAAATGAVAGRMASGSAGGAGSTGPSGPSSASKAGESTQSVSAAPSGGNSSAAGSTGGTSPGSSSGTAGGGAGVGQAGSAGSSGAGASSGAAGTAGGGAAGAGTASGGAAAASGGAAATGAAAGPAGIAVGAAAQAGQAAAGAARSVGEQSTSEGEGPDGSS